MKIAVIGAGAMGCIYGAHLSVYNEVYMVDTDTETRELIKSRGIILEEAGEEYRYFPKVKEEEIGEMDLVILFVKSVFSEVALKNNMDLIGEHTFLLSLQNGAGHEKILSKYVPMERVIIGTTEDNGTILGKAHIKRGGNKKTNLGMLEKNNAKILSVLKEVFDASDFITNIYDDIERLIWDKLIVNATLSICTGILELSLGEACDNPYAFSMIEQLLKELIAVAKAKGMDIDYAYAIDKIKKVGLANPKGYTSIYMDIKNKRKTEVDTINGEVYREGKRFSIDVPANEFAINIIHAKEC